jgi:hypothetical protein
LLCASELREWVSVQNCSKGLRVCWEFEGGSDGRRAHSLELMETAINSSLTKYKLNAPACINI